MAAGRIAKHLLKTFTTSATKKVHRLDRARIVLSHLFVSTRLATALATAFATGLATAPAATFSAALATAPVELGLLSGLFSLSRYKMV